MFDVAVNRVFLNNQMSNILMKYMLCLHVRGPQNFHSFILIFDRSLHTFVIDNKAKALLMVKEINEDCPHARPS